MHFSIGWDIALFTFDVFSGTLGLNLNGTRKDQRDSNSPSVRQLLCKDKCTRNALLNFFPIQQNSKTNCDRHVIVHTLVKRFATS